VPIDANPCECGHGAYWHSRDGKFCFGNDTQPLPLDTPVRLLEVPEPCKCKKYTPKPQQ
jgi:hypothetical protein